MRRIKLINTYNTRDLGDIPISLTKATKMNQFIRSDVMLDLTEEEIQYLKAYGVKVIIDLRNKDEVINHPNFLRSNDDFIYINIAFLNETDMDSKNKYGNNGALAKKNLPEIYLDIIDNHQGEIKKFMETIIEYSNHGILFHCSAGKDRTGVLSMMLLSLAGVNIIDILADYEISYTYLIPRLELLKKYFSDIPMHIMESKREVLLEAFNYINEKYISIEQFLKTIGLTEDQLMLIRKKIC